LTDRLDAAIDVLPKTTVDTFVAEYVDTFVAEYTETIGQHTSRLGSFYRMVTHELRQPLGTLQFGLKMLSTDEGWSSRERRERLATCERNVTKMGETLGNRNRYGTERPSGCLHHTNS
jgi:signal transduction histidine kinase